MSERSKKIEMEKQFIEDVIRFRKKLRSTLDRSGQDYKKFRETMPSGPQRTAEMTSVFTDMQEAAKKKGKAMLSPKTIKTYLESSDSGERLIGLAILESIGYDAQYFEQVLKIIDGGSFSAFEQYQALRTGWKMLRNLNNSQKRQLQKALERQREYDEDKHQWIKKGTDRWLLSKRLSSAIRKSLTN